jgi:hypothetical protein
MLVGCTGRLGRGHGEGQARPFSYLRSAIVTGLQWEPEFLVKVPAGRPAAAPGPSVDAHARSGRRPPPAPSERHCLRSGRGGRRSRGASRWDLRHSRRGRRTLPRCGSLLDVQACGSSEGGNGRTLAPVAVLIGADIGHGGGAEIGQGLCLFLSSHYVAPLAPQRLTGHGGGARATLNTPVSGGRR